MTAKLPPLSYPAPIRTVEAVMETRRARLAVCAFFACAMWNFATPVAHAQHYGAPKPKPHVYWFEDDSEEISKIADNESNANNNNSQKTTAQNQQLNSNSRQSAMQ